MSHDVIVVGSRIAGASTALLLARAGLTVLVVDRDTFPSDTLSTHQVQVPGCALLAKWGLLDKVVAAGTPATRDVRFHMGTTLIAGHFPTVAGVDAMYSPRRTILDSILIEAARDAGAEIRENSIVDELIERDGRVAGVRVHRKAGGRSDETATLVIGADGRNSFVAKAVGAKPAHTASARSVACYAYWDGFALPTGEVFSSDRRAVGVWPTNDGLVITYCAWPASEFARFRVDPERSLLETLDGAGDLGQRARAARRVSPVRATTDLPNAIRASYGDGWALAGDAGLVMDPITGQGIGNAMRDAELLTAAVVGGLEGRHSLSANLRRYQKARDRQTRAMFDFTVGLASFPRATSAEQRMFAAIADRADISDEFFSVLSGVTPITKLFSPGRLIKLVGLRTFGQLARGQQRHPEPRPAPSEEPAPPLRAPSTGTTLSGRAEGS
jgi:2-polyprenyl-6-methoxyphenol hydroxylase-like FAD-dependent oxidoreductase